MLISKDQITYDLPYRYTSDILSLGIDPSNPPRALVCQENLGNGCDFALIENTGEFLVYEQEDGGLLIYVAVWGNEQVREKQCTGS
jgi:hypothetical protein